MNSTKKYDGSVTMEMCLVCGQHFLDKVPFNHPCSNLYQHLPSQSRSMIARINSFRERHARLLSGEMDMELRVIMINLMREGSAGFTYQPSEKILQQEKSLEKRITKFELLLNFQMWRLTIPAPVGISNDLFQIQKSEIKQIYRAFGIPDQKRVSFIKRLFDSIFWI